MVGKYSVSHKFLTEEIWPLCHSHHSDRPCCQNSQSWSGQVLDHLFSIDLVLNLCFSIWLPVELPDPRHSSGQSAFWSPPGAASTPGLCSGLLPLAGQARQAGVPGTRAALAASWTFGGGLFVGRRGLTTDFGIGMLNLAFHRCAVFLHSNDSYRHYLLRTFFF